MELRHKLSDSISPKDTQAVDTYFKSRPIDNPPNTPEANRHIKTRQRSLYIGYVNEQFLKAIDIKPNNINTDIYKYLFTDYLAEHADKLLLNKVLHVDTNSKTTSKLHEFLHTNKYETGLSTILNQLKANLVESRLMEPNAHTPFKLWCSTCRSIVSAGERKGKYNTIESVFNPKDTTPKSVRQFALDNIRELAPVGEKEQFRGILSPHIVISNILYPCFLYSMDPETCDMLPEFTDEIRKLFYYMIANLPLYTLDKPSVLRFIELVTSELVDTMVTSIVWTSEQLTYTTLLTASFNTLTHPNYKYTVEDIILVYGVVIYNMPTYIDLTSASYRTAANIHPSEYRQPTLNHNAKNNNTQTPYGTIWNLPNNSQSGPKTNNTWLEPVMSKKQRKLLAKESRRTKRQLNIPFVKRKELTSDRIIKIASAIIIKGKYPYLTQTVKHKPKIYIPRLFQLVTRFNV
jgi:hypothetical protein